LITVGSLLGNLNTILDNDILWGTGAMYDTPIDKSKISKHIDVRAVRGPNTQKFLNNLGISCPSIYGDPGILAPIVYNVNKKNPIYEFGIIFHISDMSKHYNRIVNTLINNYTNFVVIDANTDIVTVLNTISLCNNIISSSLHGIIVSEAMGINSVWMECSDNVEGNGFKFYDYYLGSGRSI
jgi:hypothetical protein